MKKGQWQVTTSFFHYYSDKHYIGTEPNTRINAYDGPVNVRSQFNFDLAYAITDRWTVSLDVPIQHQRYDLHRVIPESGSTEPVPILAGADGLGDMTLRGGYWLFSPRHSRGNVFVSLGLEMPTGNSDATADVYGYQIPVDISVQPGNGAWGVVPTVHAFWTFHRFSLYGTDQYMAKIRGAVPTPLHWLSLTAGYRFSGVPVNDRYGPSDGFRHPANLQYSEPGVQILLLGRTINFSVPIVTHINVKPRIIGGVNRNTDSTVPSFMFSISYPLRFGTGHYLLMEFWATWCGPCVKGVPVLKKATELYQEWGLRILGMNSDEKVEKARRFLEKKHVLWPQSEPQSTKRIIDGELKVKWYPTMILLDPQRKILFVSGDGKRVLKGKKLLKKLDKVLPPGTQS